MRAVISPPFLSRLVWTPISARVKKELLPALHAPLIITLNMPIKFELTYKAEPFRSRNVFSCLEVGPFGTKIGPFAEVPVAPCLSIEVIPF